MQQIDVLAFDSPARAHAEITELACLIGGVPALDDAVEFFGPLVCPVSREPCRLDHTTPCGDGACWYWPVKLYFADRAADPLECLQRLALRVQCLAAPPGKRALSQLGVERPALVLLGDGRKAHDLPILLRQHVANKIVLVQPVHNQDNGTRPCVVQPAVEGVVVPLVGGLPLGLRQGLLGFQRIVDNDDVRTPAGQHSADRGGESAALRRGLELGHRLALCREANRKELPVPVADEKMPAIARQFVGEILRITDAKDLRARIVAETPRRKHHRSQVRLQVARRHIDDHPADPAAPHRLKLGRGHLEMPVQHERGAKVERVATVLRKAGKIGAQQRLVLARAMCSWCRHAASGACPVPGICAFRPAVETGPLCGPGTAIAHIAAQPCGQLSDHLFVGRAERIFLGRRRVGLFLDFPDHVDQHLGGAQFGRGGFVDQLGDDGLALGDLSEFSILGDGHLLVSAAAKRAARFFAGRPRGLPDWPFLKRVWTGGLR